MSAIPLEQPAPAAGRIAVVSHSHPSVTKGGAEIAAHTLFKGLRAIGRDAIFIGGCPAGDRAAIDLGPNEHALYHDGESYDHFYHLASRGVTGQLLDLLDRQRVTLVNLHHFMNLGLGAVRAIAERRRTVLTLHEFLAICHHHGQMITRPAHLLCSRATPRACATCFPEHSRQQFALRRQAFLDAFAEIDGFVSPSHFLAGRFREWGIDPARMHVIENGLVARDLRGPDRPRDDGHLWTFGFFGQINPFKGVGVLLDACGLIARDPALAARVRIRIHGNFVGQPDSFVERFRHAVEAHGFLSWSGPYDNGSVGRLMGACDYVLLPSSWWENSPVVIQEAYAAGRPVLCTGIGGLAEKVVDGQSGLHFEINDPADLVRAIARAASPDMFARLQAGLPAVADAAAMAERYAALFDGLEAAAAASRAPASRSA